MASTRRSFARTRLLALSILAMFATAAPAFAASVPKNLGYGLDKLVESNLALKDPNFHGALVRGYATQAAAFYGDSAIRDEATGRVLVDVTLTGAASVDAMKSAILARAASFTVHATDATYRSTGIIEGYVAVDDVPRLAATPGVRAVFLSLKPQLESATSGTPTPDAVPGDVLKKLGTAFDQGVTQHRVDRINQFYNSAAPVNYDGQGISVGAMSDSFDKRTAPPHAATGVLNFDLPGAANHPLNQQPVVVLEDLPGVGTDEGRGMVEIIHKMAPRARIGFATGNLGEVRFGNDIRALAGVPGFVFPPGVQQNFKADVIVDDVSYGGEPFYGETIIGNAIDDVTALGVSYFSSAGNNIGINAYESPLRLVPNGSGLTAATNSALAGTNIDLTNVPAGLYAGGFHNFNPIPGQRDVAQLVNMVPFTNANTPGVTEMQWDDPYDQHPLTVVQPPIYTNTGTVTSDTPVVFDGSSTPPLPQFVHGTAYVIQETATSGDLDGVLSIFDSHGNLVLTQDSVVDETVTFFPTETGVYRIEVGRFATTTGNFTLTVNAATGAQTGVTTDLNLLVFDLNGAYIDTVSLTSNNLANNRPVELGQVFAPTGSQLQFVISRANIPNGGATLPTRVRWSTRGNGQGGIGPAEYFTYNAVTTKGHATAKGTNGTAAYSVFRPNVPEGFTSPGPATILFDKDANRLATPEIREVPRVAGADQGNTSFFAAADSGSDPDTNQNFGGTSAAAPHAAAIAAMVLQARGGPGSVTPAAMRTLLQTAVFPHDLDPSFASGTALTSDGGAVVFTVESDNDANGGTGQNDPNSMQLSYLGPGSIATITFNPQGTAATGGNVTGGSNGVVNVTPAPTPPTVTYFENNFAGLVFEPATEAFTLGTLSGLSPADVGPPQFSNLAPAPSNGTSQFWTMSLAFPNANFSDGKSIRFTVGRGAQHSSTTGTVATPIAGTTTANPIADLFGGGVFLPSGVVVQDGMTFSGTTTGGGTFSGVIRNRIGKGYTRVDGYGFINAELAVLGASADLSITKTDGVTSVDAGSTVTYTIVATNPNATDAVAATVQDTFAAPLTGCSWTCTASAGGACSAGSGAALNSAVTIGAAGTVTFSATCTVDASATGTLSNTATVTGFNDSNLANNSATDNDTVVVPQADVSITKTNGVTSVQSGASTTYTIVVNNGAAAAITGVAVADAFPSQLSSCSWTCSASAGGTCTASGSGEIADSADLAPNGTATYSATCTVSGEAPGIVSNTATATYANDANASNDSATDADPITAITDRIFFDGFESP